MTRWRRNVCFDWSRTAEAPGTRVSCVLSRCQLAASREMDVIFSDGLRSVTTTWRVSPDRVPEQ